MPLYFGQFTLFYQTNRNTAKAKYFCHFTIFTKNRKTRVNIKSFFRMKIAVREFNFNL